MANVVDSLRKIDRLFVIVVILPALCAIIYFGFLASDVYVSESRFVVRSPDKPAASGLGVLLKTVGFSNAGDEVYAAHDFVLSRDALTDLNHNGAVAKAYGSQNISIFDRFNGFGFGNTTEDLFKYYVKMVDVEHDTASSITTLSVRAFTAKDAFDINRQLLQLSEAEVNRLNSRGRTDQVQTGNKEVNEAKDEARRAAMDLAAFRSSHGVIDPERQASLQLQMVSKLQDELIGARTQLLQLREMAPINPQIPILEVRIAGLAREIETQMGQVAGNRGSLSASAGEYARLQLQQTYADRRLTAALTSLQEARNEGERKQAYVETIVQPNLPDEAQLPRRLRGIVATSVFALIVWSIITMLIAGIREHSE